LIPLHPSAAIVVVVGGVPVIVVVVVGDLCFKAIMYLQVSLQNWRPRKRAQWRPKTLILPHPSAANWTS
jgi:hypothetical protein